VKCGGNKFNGWNISITTVILKNKHKNINK